jgi:hypothetical protein
MKEQWGATPQLLLRWGSDAYLNRRLGAREALHGLPPVLQLDMHARRHQPSAARRRRA